MFNSILKLWVKFKFATIRYIPGKYRKSLISIYYLLKSIPYGIMWHTANFFNKTDDIIFYVLYPLHYVLFRDIHKLLPKVTIVPSNYPDAINYLKRNNIIFKSHSYPKMVIMADFCENQFLLKNINKIYIPHGIVGKNYMYSYDKNKNFDLILQLGDYAVSRLKQMNINTSIKVGYAILDRLFNGSLNREEILKNIGADPGKKTILYAPTWGVISSLELIKDKIAEVAKNVNILIKLHPGANDESIYDETKKYNSLYRNLKGVILIEDFADIIPYLFASNILISDYSSVIFMFASMDKPVVLVNASEEAMKSRIFDQTSMETTMRDIGENVNTFDELKTAVDKALKHPEINSEKRKNYTQQLFYKLDGKSAERSAQAIKDFYFKETGRSLD
ncbi:MAG: CDP-glycerol glycerophosphotransferase family protein [Endomicrobiales bacterium]|nr:CDP-glycerol glycerophosphotransferase family protein [Endomicrobiales bacterium]